MARAAFDSVNSDKVDGRHAVGAGAGTAQRKGKLVAANDRTGRLPNDIIRKAPDPDLLDGRDSSAYRVTGRAQTGSFVNINGCGSGEITSYTLHVTRRTQLFAAATSTYGRSNPGPERPTMRVQLLDSGSTVVAATGRVSVDATTGNPSLTVAGMLVAAAGGGAYQAAPGDYTLRLWGDNFGACTGFGQYQEPQLSHLVLPGT